MQHYIAVVQEILLSLLTIHSLSEYKKMNITERPLYKRPNRYKAMKPLWCEISPPEKWVYQYDSPNARKVKILTFLMDRGKSIAERDLENAFCYSTLDVTWTIKDLLKEGRIKREIVHFGKRKVAFVSAVNDYLPVE